MSVKLKFKIGGIVVEVTGQHEEDAWKEASFWNELPCECGNCQSKLIALRFRQAKEYDFYELICRECGYTYACGQKMGGGLYPRGNKETGEWDPPYEGGGGGGSRDERTDNRRTETRSNDRPPQGRQQDNRGARQPDNRGQGSARGNDSGARGRQDPPAQQQDTRQSAKQNAQPADPLDDDDIPF